MPTERDSGSAESTSFIGRIDAESKRLAKQLNDLQLIYAFYGFLDGLSLGYSTLSFYFSVFYPETDFGSPSDTMHDWVITPTGAAAAASETIALAVFALLANLIEDKEEDTFKKFLAFAWSVTRDSAKALKNGYKGIRSTLQAVSVLSGHDLRYMIVPVGLAFGIVSLLHRFWFRKYVKEPRLDMTRTNGEILLELKQTCFYTLDALPAAEEMRAYRNSYILVGEILHYITGNGLVDEVKIRDREKFFIDLAMLNSRNGSMFLLSDKNAKQLITDNSYTDDIGNENKGYASLGGLDKAVCARYRTTLREQKEQLSESLNKRSIIGASFSGVVDGLYIYMGAVGLTALTPPVFIAMTIFSAFFASVCVVIRGYEEYDYQRRFKATQAKVELALCCKELEALFGSLQRLSDIFRRSKLSNNELVMLFNEVDIDRTESPLDLVAAEEDTRVRCLYEARTLQQRLTDSPAGDAGVDTLKAGLIDKLKVLYAYELTAKESEFRTKRSAVSSLVTASNLLAVLTGIRHGLAAYSAITALMFAFATIEAMFLTPFSPAVLLAGVMIGMVCLAICLVHAIVSVVSKPNQTAETGAPREEDVGNPELFTLLAELKNRDNTIQDKPPYEIKKAVLGGSDVQSTPRALIWERFEVFRSLGSGFVKGPKLIALFYSILVSSNEGEHDTPVLFRIAIVGALLQAAVFAGRALARGLGKDAPDAPLDDADRSQGDRGGVLPEGGEGTLPPSLPLPPPAPPSSPSRWGASFFSSTSKGDTPISFDSSAPQL